MHKISAVIITFNEERNIERCIRSVLQFVDEVVVLDSFSTDKTEEICKALGVNFFQNKFEGHIEQKNEALAYAKNNMILSLDADECLTKQAQEEIIALRGTSDFDGFSFPRLNNYCGTWVRHSGMYPDRKLRLFDKTKGKWGGQNPHDQFILESPREKKLSGDILHYSFSTKQEAENQIDKFTMIAAKALFRKGKRYNPLKKYASAIAILLSRYVLKLGFLDGSVGIELAILSFKAKILKFNRLKKLQDESITPQ